MYNKDHRLLQRVLNNILVSQASLTRTEEESGHYNQHPVPRKNVVNIDRLHVKNANLNHNVPAQGLMATAVCVACT